MRPATEFKFACPVCHQHIIAASASAGAQIECPTCFRQIIIPRAPGGDTTKLILRGTQAGTGQAQTRFQPASAGSKSPAASTLLKTAAAVSLLLVGLVFFVSSLSKLNNQLHSSASSASVGQTAGRPSGQ